MKKGNANARCPRADIGGQAVLDGVMMKSPDAVAVAVRRPNGDIVVKREPYVSPAKKHKWMGWPFIRGSVSMVQMLGLGMRVLEDSMKMSGEGEEEPSKFEKWLAKKLGKSVDKVVMGTAIVLAVAMSVGLFVLLPNLVIKLFPDTPKDSASWTLLLKNLVSGLVRTLLLIGYIALVGQVPDMKKTFQYHGSEHKTVFCHEHDLPLTPQNARQFSRLHPRCGTSFLLLTFILSILFYSVIDVLVWKLTGFNLGNHYLWRVLSRLILLPCVAGISYEILKGVAHAETPLTRALRWPGLQMQRLTTREPSDSQLEVAIASMNAALHGLPEGEKTEEGWIVLHKEEEKAEEK